MKVKAFAGNKDQIWSLYYKLLLSENLSVELVGDGRIAELKVEPKDYVRAIAVGTELANKKNYDAVVWVSPEGNMETRFGDTTAKTSKFNKVGQMTAFTGTSAIDASGVASYLKKMADIEALASRTENGMWEVVVPTEDYFQAVNIGAKFIDGRKIVGVWWNDPTGQHMFDVQKLAKVARTENDDILEA